MYETVTLSFLLKKLTLVLYPSSPPKVKNKPTNPTQPATSHVNMASLVFDLCFALFFLGSSVSGDMRRGTLLT